VQHRMQTVRAELYNGYDDSVRFGFEIILSIWVYSAMLYTFYEIALAQKEQGNFLKYFMSYWNWLDFACTSLLTCCVTLWWHFVVNHVRPFTLSLRHDVYDNLQAEANFLELANGYNVPKRDRAYGREIITNERPRCTQLFSLNELPYAFQHIPLKTKRDGFPAFFDINLSEQEAQDWATYLEEGLYIDDLTHEVTAEVLTYNAPLRIVGYLLMGFKFTSGGTITVRVLQ
ncbi:hypothetical protein DUNSADRAFT_6611, partial [Dunaliella salina]